MAIWTDTPLLSVMLVAALSLAGCSGQPTPFSKKNQSEDTALLPPVAGYHYAGALDPTLRPTSAIAAPVTQPKSAVTQIRATRGVKVAMVTGAGITGNKELRDAMVRSLMSSDVQLSRPPFPPRVTIAARVRLGTPQNGVQPVAIDWQVLDAAGKLVGTVSQQNSIQAGNLARSWYDNADGAARAAAPEISRLIAAAR